MRVLAISTPSTTHFMPAIPLVWALRAAGHDVVFAGQPDVVGMARAAGLPTVTIGHRYDDGDTSWLPAGKRPVEAGLAQLPKGYEVHHVAPWVFHARYLLGPYLDFARAWRPDLIITDPLEYAGLLVGAVLGVPTVHHRWGPEVMTAAGWRLAREVLSGKARGLGLADGVPQPTVTLDPFPSQWAIPEVTPGEPIRPTPYNGGGPVPPWVARRTADRRVCVTFGLTTLKLNGLPLVRHVVDAFDGVQDVEALVTLDQEYHDQLGPLPAGVRLVEPAPLNTFMDSCDAVVHHGGAGTITTALMAGVPHLLLPQMMDQAARCEQMAASGVAICLPRASDQNDPATIRDALLTLLEQPTYRETAAELREQAERLPSPAEVATRLESLAAGRG